MGAGNWRQAPISPVIGLEAEAWSFIGTRPARKALRPAETASRIASAMSTGSFASAIAVFIRMATAPSSIAMAASLAVPTPASTRTGTFAVSMMIRRLYGLRMPRPLPIGAPSGMMAAQPASWSRCAVTGSSLVYGITTKPSFTRTFAAWRSPSTSGKSVRLSPMTSSFTRSPIPSSRPSRAVRTASSAVKQAAVLGRRIIFFGIHSRSDASPFAERSSRRTATVTTSAPEASSARFIVGKSGYLPVPTRRRLVKVCLPMLQVSAMVLPSSDEGDDLDRVTGTDPLGLVAVLGDDGLVQLHGDARRLDAEVGEEPRDGGAFRDLTEFTIDPDLHGVAI